MTSHKGVHPKAEALVTELFFVADEYITVDTAQRLLNELGLTNFDIRDIEH